MVVLRFLGSAAGSPFGRWYDSWTPDFEQILTESQVIFTVANLIIADSFSAKTQGLAGAVFNTIAQFGTSIGLTVFAIISSRVTQESSYNNKGSPDALMVGYRAVFWTSFALMMVAAAIGAWGLRKAGKVGLKTE
jgi:hypothetical protein